MVKDKPLISILIVIISVSVFFFLLTAFFRLVPGGRGIPTGNEQLKIESDEFIGVTLKIPGAEKSGHWELKVARLESQDGVGQMKEIKGDYFLNKKTLYHVKAESGTIYWKTRILKVNGKVVFKTNDGKELRAEEISWDPNIRRIVAQDKVILKSPGFAVSTAKIESELGLDRVIMSGMTKAVYQR